MLKLREKNKNYKHYLSMQNIIKKVIKLMKGKGKKSNLRCQYFLLLTVMKLCSNKITYISHSDIVLKIIIALTDERESPQELD